MFCHEQKKLIHPNNVNVTTIYNAAVFVYVVPIAIQAFVQTFHRPDDPLVIAVEH
jgi:hypothetical protein